MNEKYKVPQEKATVDFTQVAIVAYLDKCIERWRTIRDSESGAEVELPGSLTIEEIEGLRNAAKYYIDAFQSVRVSLFGSTKP